MTEVLEGTRLSVARRRRGMKQSELAKKLDLPEKTVRAWEEKTEWCEDKEVALRLAWLLKFPIGWFYGSELELIDESRVSFRR